MPLIEPCIPTPKEQHELDLWVKEECYRFYVQQRRLNCTFMEVMDLWLRAPYCMECSLSDSFGSDLSSDINPDTWEEDIAWVVGRPTLERTKRELISNPDFAFLCKKCGREIRPWNDDGAYVVSYHLEEHYGIPFETAGRKSPSKKINKRILKLYDNNCFSCGSNGRSLHIDHIIPQSNGGDAAFRNLQPLCKECGNRKGNRLPEEIKVFSDIYFGPYPSDAYEGLFW